MPEDIGRRRGLVGRYGLGNPATRMLAWMGFILYLFWTAMDVAGPALRSQAVLMERQYAGKIFKFGQDRIWWEFDEPTSKAHPVIRLPGINAPWRLTRLRYRTYTTDDDSQPYVDLDLDAVVNGAYRGATQTVKRGQRYMVEVVATLQTDVGAPTERKLYARTWRRFP